MLNNTVVISENKEQFLSNLRIHEFWEQAPKRNRSLKEGLMEVVSKSKQFETLKQSLVRLRNDASIVVEEKEENLTPREKEAPKTPFNPIPNQQYSTEGES